MGKISGLDPVGHFPLEIIDNGVRVEHVILDKNDVIDEKNFDKT